MNFNADSLMNFNADSLIRRMRNGQIADMDIGIGIGRFHCFAGRVCGGKDCIGGAGDTAGREAAGRNTGKVTEQAGAGCRSFRASEYSEA